MSNESSNDQVNNDNNNNDLTAKLAEKDEMIKNLQSQFDAVSGKNTQLLDETKKAKSKAREESDRLEQSRIDKATKDGDYEQLLKSSEAKRIELEEKHSKLENKISRGKVQAEAMRIAAELADGYNVELLAEQLVKRLKNTEKGVQVLNESGDLTVSPLTELKAEFENNDKFKSLIRGNKSSGGGAVGDGGSASGGSTIDNNRFEAMNAVQKMAFVQKGGKVQG